MYSIVQAKIRSHLSARISRFFSLAYPLEDIRREIIVLKVVQAILNHLTEVKGFGPAGMGSEKIQPLLSFHGQSNRGRHIYEYVYSLYHQGDLHDEIEPRFRREGAEILDSIYYGVIVTVA